MAVNFEHISFARRLGSMLAVDFRRLLRARFFYVMLGTCLAIPILILVMTTMAGGGADGFENTWQIIGTPSGSDPMAAGMTGMCNVNLLYFLAAVAVALFLTGDFKSGYAKNLLAARARKADYVISKTLAGLVCGAAMLACFLIGSMIGGGVAGLPFDLDGISGGSIVLCMVSKVCLMAVFVPIYVLMGALAKQRTWLAIVGSLAIGMMLFMAIPALTPLDATAANVVVCLAVGAVLCVGLGILSTVVLSRTDLA